MATQAYLNSIVDTIVLLFNTPIAPPPELENRAVPLTELPPSRRASVESRRRSNREIASEAEFAPTGRSLAEPRREDEGRRSIGSISSHSSETRREDVATATPI